MRKTKIKILISVLALTLITLTFMDSGGSSQELPSVATITQVDQVPESEETTTTKQVEVVPEQSIPIYNIPLSEELQEYIYRTAEEFDLSYELLLAIIHTESRFDKNAVGQNKTSKDKGLMQLNNRYMNHYAKLVGIKNFDPFNPYHNVKVGAYILAENRDYWLKKGYSQEGVFLLAVSSYNKGRAGVQRTGISRSYVRKVEQFKYRLEGGEF